MAGYHQGRLAMDGETRLAIEETDRLCILKNKQNSKIFEINLYRKM